MHVVLDRDIVVLSAARTPVGRFDGLLCEFTAIDLGALAIGAAVGRAGLTPADVDTVNLGMVVSAGMGVAPAKAAAAEAGLPQGLHSRTVETVCGSQASGWRCPNGTNPARSRRCVRAAPRK